MQKVTPGLPSPSREHGKNLCSKELIYAEQNKGIRGEQYFYKKVVNQFSESMWYVNAPEKVIRKKASGNLL